VGVGPPRVVARDARRGTGQFRVEAALAAAAFAVLCVAVLKVALRLVEPDDYAYRGSILAITHGHLLTLSTAQSRALAGQLAHVGRGQIVGGPGGPLSMIRFQWAQLPGGRWISEKDPGYPFLAVPFQALGVIRLAPLFYGALGCLGLFAGARRWLGRFGGAAAVGLFCSSGATLLFAWRDYMPTFTDASLIAAGTMPMVVLALAGLAWISGRWTRLRRADGQRGRLARRDVAVGLALAASWATVWALYATCTWTASPAPSTLQASRFYVPALGAISLLGAWPVVRVARRAPLAAAASAAAVVAMFGLGIWSFHSMLNPQNPGPAPAPHCNIGQPHCPSSRRRSAGGQDGASESDPLMLAE
jgi:hypothetical protein